MFVNLFIKQTHISKAQQARESVNKKISPILFALDENGFKNPRHTFGEAIQFERGGRVYEINSKRIIGWCKEFFASGKESVRQCFLKLNHTESVAVKNGNPECIEISQDQFLRKSLKAE